MFTTLQAERINTLIYKGILNRKKLKSFKYVYKNLLTQTHVLNRFSASRKCVTQSEVHGSALKAGITFIQFCNKITTCNPSLR